MPKCAKAAEHDGFALVIHTKNHAQFRNEKPHAMAGGNGNRPASIINQPKTGGIIKSSYG